ncbi:MAG: helicase-related protein [Desulfotomaculaceae bacterium]|nr:helicase-related protein [Desulfotomaculaceae bacterium]
MVIYEAKKTKLIAQDILAKPIFIEKQTGSEYRVDDSLYERLVRQHKDLPENIIEKLATDSARNDYIVHEYLENKGEYGKTIIFADRWFQCAYLETKLKKEGIKVESVFSRIDADPGSPEERNKRTATDNERIIKEFKEGKHDVLINVRMLAEGANVPDVKTVFLTRQTTSSILFNQMMGRALRGRKAGGGKNKADANIVLFIDDWKRLIKWARPDGSTEDNQPPVRGYYPLELISTRLIEELSRQIENGISFPSRPYMEYIPVGWYQAQLTVNTSEGANDELQNFTEFIMVYEFNKDKFDKAIEFIKDNYHEEWGNEKLDDTIISAQIDEIINKFFEPEQDDIGDTLKSDLIKIARHIVRTDETPEYYSFDVRTDYDIDAVAYQMLDKKPMEINAELQQRFNKSGSLWKVFYGDYFRFKTAVDIAINIILSKGPYPPPIDSYNGGNEPNSEVKLQVLTRDGEKCLCCGRKKGKGIRLEIDHIIPTYMGGKTNLDNLQTLCSFCNKNKGINEINFRDIHSSPLRTPKKLEFPQKSPSEDVGSPLKRIINFFYHCQAVANLSYHLRSSGQHYSTWGIKLFSGNNADWLEEQKSTLLEYIHNDLNLSHVQDLIIIGA